MNIHKKIFAVLDLITLKYLIEDISYLYSTAVPATRTPTSSQSYSGMINNGNNLS